jgi:DNA repair protein RecN (Recombination protein N)
MLSLIRAKNYAVIDEVELELSAGLSVMTGETGAGKSILVDALGLVLGDRADAASVRHGAERAEISAVFDCPAGHASLAWLRERGLDDADSCTLRRVITAEGRSRAFINNQPVTLQDLKALGDLLIDIHGQHAHQSLLDNANQRALLDGHGGLTELVQRVAQAHAEWRRLQGELEARRAAGNDRAAQLDTLRFQAGELETLALAQDEPAQLHAERERLANTDRLIAGVSATLGHIYENEGAAAYSLVVHAEQALRKLVEHDATLANALQRLAGVEIELRELASELNHYRERIEADPERLEWVENRLAKMRALARRHGVDEDHLPNVLPALQQRIAELDGGGETLEVLAERASSASADYFTAADALSAARRKHARKLSALVTAQLADLGMPHGELNVELQAKPRERADATGLERVEFQVKLNPGQPFGALAKMASGGELSRISLALEVVRSGASPVLSFVFDEVDAGVGGRVAEIVGRRLRELAASRQVLCVTHLPQVASQGQRHYRVVKLDDGKTSRTNVRQLSSAERVEELSRMLGGIEITERTRAHAAEMIDRAAK